MHVQNLKFKGQWVKQTQLKQTDGQTHYFTFPANAVDYEALSQHQHLRWISELPISTNINSNVATTTNKDMFNCLS